MANRMSMYSNVSAPLAARSTGQQSSQVSTTTLLNSLHTIYTSGRTYQLESSTSLVVNTWISAAESGNGDATVDEELARRAWEHARRRAEDGCIVLGSLHHSTPSVLIPFISTLPLEIPTSLFTALSVLKPFLFQQTPFNSAFGRHSSLAATFNFNLAGEITGATVALSTSGIHTRGGLLNIPAESGYRAFDIFHYLLTSASTPAEREFLALRHPSAYALLNKSATYDPPSYLPAADDTASAEDFRNSLKSIGIKGSALRNLLSVLTGLLKLGDTLGFLIDAEELDDVCEDVGGLLGLDPEVVARKCSTDDRGILIAALYECLVDWIISKANDAIRAECHGSGLDSSSDISGVHTPGCEDDGDTVSLTIIEIPGQDLGKAVALRGVFDDSAGINSEMKDDGIEVVAAGSSVMKEMQTAVNDNAADLGITGGPVARERGHEQDRKEAILERVGAEADDDAFLRTIIYPPGGEGASIGRHGRFDLSAILESSRVWYHLSLHPTDDSPAKLASLPTPTSAWSAGAVSRQLRAWRLPEWANRRNRSLDYTADFDIDEFATRYSRLGCQEGRDGVESWILERGWSNGEAVIGHERVWIRENAWWDAESMLDLKPEGAHTFTPGISTGYAQSNIDLNASGFFPPMNEESNPFLSQDNLVSRQPSFGGDVKSAMGGARSIAPTVAKTLNTMVGDYGLGAKGDEKRYYDGEYDGRLDPEMGEPKTVTSQKMDPSRRAWVAFTWACTFWIPSFLLRYVGRMKRPDVRMAWREKLTLMMLIFLLNAVVIFYIVEFGRLLCPNNDKVWDPTDVSTHQGDDDFYVSIHGKVYDISKFWQVDHSDVSAAAAGKSQMQPFAGQDLDSYFPPPLYQACPFVTDDTIKLTPNETVSNPTAIHYSAKQQLQYPKSALAHDNWYRDTFLPKIQEYYKGALVFDKGNVTTQGKDDQRMWIILHGKVYDFTDYFKTLTTEDPNNVLPKYDFLPADIKNLVQSNPGADITDQWKTSRNYTDALTCMNNVFYKGDLDFRKSAKCQVNNYILLAFTIILCTVIGVKFIASLQFGSKRRPLPQDKFVICQVPAYTEGEDQLRKGLDSLTALEYDNKRKLICVICDGMIVGAGNDRPTPKIVLDILGVDPKVDPPALPFKSVGTGSDQLNYGKVYSGLYEFEGNVVPYIVVVKVGKESEQTKAKPGNRGKRDSQIMLMSFLNRVHHRSPMNPLELEMFHQINNIIGVDPELYEYLFMVDADTSVREDSLTRLVASCANDAKIAGICGETSLQNEDRSWWTMIQVYEYFISHHLAKAFESLFGSVTCLPGCFTMYRLRTADKGRPLIISDKIIQDYGIGDVDTLHKKNLFSLGEDRYLTTLMTKHFPQMSYKFIPDAYAATAAPEDWNVLLSQRRRWINSTIHNLVELSLLKDLCGFCCFSMRFVVFLDLFGTLILPATCGYLGYLIYRVATHTGPFPLISLIMIAAVYGLQALVFLLRRQWQHIGWMIIYILAFPVYSFILPVYSFWKQDDFSWGTTRIVIGEKGSKQIIAMQDEGFDPRSIPLQRWDDYAANNNLPGRRSFGAAEKAYDPPGYSDNAYEMDDFRTQYSSARPASTVLTGFRNQAYMPPQSPAEFGHTSRQSTATLGQFRDVPQQHQRMQSTGNLTEPYRDMPSSHSPHMSQSYDNLMGHQTPPLRTAQRSPLGHSRPVSTVDFRGVSTGPDDMAITDAIRSCLAEVDLDNVTKKQVRALVEQRLQCEITGEKRAFMDQQIDAELANMYTASFAFFEALWEAGVKNVFVNLGSDHPSIIEAMVKGQSEKADQFPKIYTCPNEMVALSMADGYARLTGLPQCVIVHVDVGTQGLGAAVHNASCGRAPILIFAGLSPYTIEGEHRGSRTEYIHWIQDVPDQKQIVAQYCRYTGEIKTGANVKQMVRRALQFATTAPCGPVYLCGAREPMEAEIEPYALRDKLWGGVGPGALPAEAIEEISRALVEAKEPLIVTGYSGRDHASPDALVALAETAKGIRVLDTGGSDMCFPANHRASLGLRYGVHPAIGTADFILVLDCDIPWIPTHNAPTKSCRIFHVDVDPLKQQMPVFYIEAEGRWKADAATSVRQITAHLKSSPSLTEKLSTPHFADAWTRLGTEHEKRLSDAAEAAEPPSDGTISTALLGAALRRVVPEDTIFAVEAVTNTGEVADQIQPSAPGTWINCGGGGLGWSGGGALGIALASSQTSPDGKPRFVCQIVGDGTFLFSVPGSVYWIAERYDIPLLTVVLNNEGWNAPRKSLLLVHPGGAGSRVDNKALNISFAPTPDYAGIAKAATGGKCWAGQALRAETLEEVLREAVDVVVKGGRAVVDAHLGGSVGKFVAGEGQREGTAAGEGKGVEMSEGKSVG